MRYARVAPIPPRFVWVVCFFVTCWGSFFLVPPSLPPVTVPISPLVACGCFFFPAPPGVPLLLRLLLPLPLLPACSVLYALRQCFVVLLFLPPPPLSLRILPCGFLPLQRLFFFFFLWGTSAPEQVDAVKNIQKKSVCWFFFTLLPACMQVSTAQVIGSRVPLVFVSGPIALMGRAPWRSPATPGGRPSLASLSSLPWILSPPLSPRSPVPRPPS